MKNNNIQSFIHIKCKPIFIHYVISKNLQESIA